MNILQSVEYFFVPLSYLAVVFFTFVLFGFSEVFELDFVI